MDNNNLLENFEKLVFIQKRQLELATLERYDEQLSEIQNLERQKVEHQIAIQTYRAKSSDYKLLPKALISQVVDYIEKLQEMNQQLEKIISEWYNMDSQSMKQVRQQRQTLQTYGGVNYSDIISYYIDRKE